VCLRVRLRLFMLLFGVSVYRKLSAYPICLVCLTCAEINLALLKRKMRFSSDIFCNCFPGTQSDSVISERGLLGLHATGDSRFKSCALCRGLHVCAHVFACMHANVCFQSMTRYAQVHHASGCHNHAQFEWFRMHCTLFGNCDLDFDSSSGFHSGCC
jgi:hypothetical protein